MMEDTNRTSKFRKVVATVTVCLLLLCQLLLNHLMIFNFVRYVSADVNDGFN